MVPSQLSCNGEAETSPPPAHFPLANPNSRTEHRPMKSFLLMLLTFLVLIAVVGGGGALFYLSKTSEYSRTANTPPPSSPER
jgi:hypothetical protein